MALIPHYFPCTTMQVSRVDTAYLPHTAYRIPHTTYIHSIIQVLKFRANYPTWIRIKHLQLIFDNVITQSKMHMYLLNLFK